jgi:hypothetical protein
MDLDGIGYFQALQAEKARIRAAASKNMSPAALARLPKPIVIKREALAPVILATKRDAISPLYKTSAKKAALASAARRASTGPMLKVKRVKPARLHLLNGRADGAGDRALFEKIVELAATASGLTTYELHDFKRERKTVAVRHVCWRLLREFTGLSTGAMAKLTGRGCHSSIMNGIGKAMEWTATPQGAALYWELRTRLSTLGCVIVDDLEIKRGGK